MFETNERLLLKVFSEVFGHFAILYSVNLKYDYFPGHKNRYMQGYKTRTNMVLDSMHIKYQHGTQKYYKKYILHLLAFNKKLD